MVKEEQLLAALDEELQYDKELGRKPKYMGHFFFGGSVNFNAFYTQVISTHAARIRQL